MGVYIPKLTLPSVDSGGYHIEIDASGFTKVSAFNRGGEFWAEELVTDAIEVEEPHGDLIDRDTLMYKERRWDNDYAPDGYDHIVEVDDIKNAPTIIKAEE